MKYGVSNSTPYITGIHISTPSKIEQTLNRPITLFNNRNEVNVIAVELRNNLLHETKVTYVNQIWKKLS